MFRVLFLISVFFLTGCFMLPLEEPEMEYLQSTPAAVNLTDKNGQLIGKAIPFKNNVYVTPDHLWQETPALYYERRPIEVLVRDFQHDVLFFRTPRPFTQKVTWQLSPPGVGQTLQWFDGFQLHEVQVLAANERFFSLDEITNLMSINDVLEPGDSGSPVFDDQGQIYGMLIGTDKAENKAYFVRSDIILDLAKEYLLEA